MYEDVISTYLVKLSQKNLSENDSKSVQRVLHGIGDFERISDHAMNIVGAAKEIEEKKAVFSEGAMAGLHVMMDAIKEIINNATLAFINNDVKLAAKVEPLEQVIDRIRDKLKEAHVKRLTNGECTIELGFIFSDLIQVWKEFPTIVQTLRSVLLKSTTMATMHTNICTNLKIPMIFSTTQTIRNTRKNMHFPQLL